MRDIARQKVFLVALSALVFGILVDYFLYGKPLGVSFFLFVLLFAGASLLLARISAKKLSRTQALLLFAALVLAAGVFVRSSGFLTFFNFWGSIYVLLLFFVLFFEPALFSSSLLRYISAPLSFLRKAFSAAAQAIEQLPSTLLGRKQTLGSWEFQSVLRGVLIALPILLIFGALLYSADLVVQRFLEQLIDIDVNPEFLLRILIVFVASYLFLGMFFQLVQWQGEGRDTRQKQERKLFGFIEASTVLILLELLFFGFIAVQFFYLFGGAGYLWEIPEYVTYAEYARRGFGELIGVAFLSFFLLYGLDVWSKRQAGRQEKVFRVLAGLLTVEVFVIMLSAWQRLSLYIDGYGFTFMRLLAFFFLVWVFAVFALLLLKLVWRKGESIFLALVFWLTIAWWVGFNGLNPDAFAAKKNIERYVQGKELDVVYYRFTLSDDAVPQLMRVFQLQEGEKLEEVKKDVALSLYWRYIKPWQDEDSSFRQKVTEAWEIERWQSFQLARKSAVAAIRENMEAIERHQMAYWEKEEKECREELRECEGKCAGIPDTSELAMCRQRTCSYTRLQSQCEDLRKKTDTDS